MGENRPVWPFVTTVVLLMSWTALTIVQSLSPHALSSRDPAAVKVRDTVLAIAPQRWEFFTASSKGRQYVAYRTQTGESALSLPQARATNMFGVSRAQRAQGPELAALHQRVANWTKCTDKSASQKCIRQAAEVRPQSLKNEAKRRTLCGDLLLAQEKATPFEFRSFDLPNFRVLQAARVEVSCN
ncbi:SdpA family antimicrobial peptide system protein [Curtobacterium sp. SORGH_AS_0776]|uniref:SdpA family antimicrobial peptide system protein n=1 Tax=Curtobacterium sp. SORGH_AS_0776 TaxID=3041798 RepID=UPI0028619C03|nr:SdpA family antimicrobial peptide system protein [Curtobacterium sp. SORGH_AS_0776]MDR6169140.1 antimicrobial peptide system SdpA family protein [Curtobacterium sp. SORGH_AS_0776]